MKIIRLIAIIISAAAAVVLVALLFFMLTEYRPPQAENIQPLKTVEGSRPPGGLRIVSWNIGYCGLDENMDFFMEGGESTERSPLQNQRNALDSIIEEMEKQEADVYFFQEVDRDSKRSFRVDQFNTVESSFGQYEAYHALNFKSPFVPIPVQAPIGRVESGIATLSRYSVSEAVRYQLPGKFSWPVSIFHLKRCILVTQMPSASEGKDWYLINIHLTAYGDGGQRKQQLEYLKEMITGLYKEGHYVVVGGDWNSLFPGIDRNHFGEYSTPEESLFWLQDIPEGWTPDNWQWCYDDGVPTSRTLEQPYRAGSNFTTVIDGFLISPNLRVDEIRGLNQRFKYSDHNPVAVTVSIRD